MASKYDERQMWNVIGLSYPPREGCTVTEYRTEQWPHGHIHVHRTFRPDHAPSLSYTQGFVVGPRGGIKTIYDHSNY